jgi:hypothetical protein
MSLLVQKKTHEFFEEQLKLAAQNQRQAIDPPTLTYVSTTLSEFMHSDQLFMQDPSDGKSKNETLAHLYFDAVNAPTPELAAYLFRRMGDVSMVVTGFFADSLNRKIVDIDYYMEMGGTAYGQVASRANDVSVQSLFSTLSVNFTNYVNLVSEVSMRSFADSSKDVLSVYEKYLKTKSPFLGEKLREMGVFPVDQDDTSFKQ